MAARPHFRPRLVQAATRCDSNSPMTVGARTRVPEERAVQHMLVCCACNVWGSGAMSARTSLTPSATAATVLGRYRCRHSVVQCTSSVRTWHGDAQHGYREAVATRLYRPTKGPKDCQHEAACQLRPLPRHLWCLGRRNTHIQPSSTAPVTHLTHRSVQCCQRWCVS